jgi:hypothetical protein
MQRSVRRSNTYEIYSDTTKIAVLGGTTHTLKFVWYGRREETWRYLDGSSRGTLGFTSFADFAGTCPTYAGVSQIETSTIHTGDTLGHWYRYPLGRLRSGRHQSQPTPDCEHRLAV